MIGSFAHPVFSAWWYGRFRSPRGPPSTWFHTCNQLRPQFPPEIFSGAPSGWTFRIPVPSWKGNEPVRENTPQNARRVRQQCKGFRADKTTHFRFFRDPRWRWIYWDKRLRPFCKLSETVRLRALMWIWFIACWNVTRMVLELRDALLKVLRFRNSSGDEHKDLFGFL